MLIVCKQDEASTLKLFSLGTVQITDLENYHCKNKSFETAKKHFNNFAEYYIFVKDEDIQKSIQLLKIEENKRDGSESEYYAELIGYLKYREKLNAKKKK